MTNKRKHFYSRLDKPTNYYRSGVSFDDVRRAMEDSEWMTVLQVAAILSPLVPPEAKVRYFQMHGGRISTPLEKQLLHGMRDIARRTISRLVYDGRIEKNGKGRKALYRWVANEANRPQANPPGRRHAKPGGAKRGRDKGVRRSNGGRD